MADTVIRNDVDWTELVRKADADIDKPEPAWEFSNGAKFFSPFADSSDPYND